MPNKLKPCPFCGNDKFKWGRVFGTEFSGDFGWYLVCTGCGTHTKAKGTKRAVRKLWNRRSDNG